MGRDDAGGATGGAATRERGPLARTEIRQGLKRGRIDIRDALDHPATQRMPVVDLLAYLPGRRNGCHGKQVRRADALVKRIAKEAGSTPRR